MILISVFRWKVRINLIYVHSLYKQKIIVPYNILLKYKLFQYLMLYIQKTVYDDRDK